jgi:AhpD family alkylhydroperoxidase
MLDAGIKELIAIGSSVAANCHPCVKHHVGKAREMEIAEDDIRQAIGVGQMVRKGAADQMDKLLEEIKHGT